MTQTRQRRLVLPDFPWDRLAPAAAAAGRHPDGIVDLSVGTPVDPTPEVIQQALCAAADAPGYPLTRGTSRLRTVVAEWFARRRSAPGVDPDAVLPTIGSKELVAGLPMLLGLGPGDAVAYPHVAYPTYDVGARLAGAASAPYRDLDDLRRRTDVRLVWLNSPGNPTGALWRAAEMGAVVAWARERGAVVASDECYAELGWDGVEVVSVLDPRVCGHSHRGLLAVYSLSKQSSMAGYRAGLVAGDPVLVAQVLEVRKHAGLMVPWPVQQAIIAALGDDAHVAEQKERYGRRRALLLPALRSAGFTVDDSEAGLYLWATRGRDGWADVDWFAARGILVAPGDFYGAAGARHIRCALTASDERIDAAVHRITL